jgi:hypothetical protein
VPPGAMGQVGGVAGRDGGRVTMEGLVGDAAQLSPAVRIGVHKAHINGEVQADRQGPGWGLGREDRSGVARG